MHRWLMFFLVGWLWGGSFIFMDLILTQLPFTYMVIFRLAIGGIVFMGIILVFVGRKKIFNYRYWMMWIPMGFFGAILPFMLIGFGIQHTGPGVAAILNAMTPLWTLLIAIFLGSEKVSFTKVMGVAIAIAGVVLVLSPSFGWQDFSSIGLSSVEFDRLMLIGSGAILVAGMLYATNLILTRRILDTKPISPIEHAGGQTGAAGILLVLWLPFINPIPVSSNIITAVSIDVWVSVVCLSVLSTVLAYTIFVRLVSMSGPFFASLAILQTPVTAAIMATMFLGKSLNQLQIIGMIIVLLGLIFVESSKIRLPRRRPPAP